MFMVHFSFHSYTLTDTMQSIKLKIYAKTMFVVKRFDSQCFHSIFMKIVTISIQYVTDCVCTRDTLDCHVADSESVFVCPFLCFLLTFPHSFQHAFQKSWFVSCFCAQHTQVLFSHMAKKDNAAHFSEALKLWCCQALNPKRIYLMTENQCINIAIQCLWVEVYVEYLRYFFFRFEPMLPNADDIDFSII